MFPAVDALGAGNPPHRLRPLTRKRREQYTAPDNFPQLPASLTVVTNVNDARKDPLPPVTSDSRRQVNTQTTETQSRQRRNGHSHGKSPPGDGETTSSLRTKTGKMTTSPRTATGKMTLVHKKDNISKLKRIDVYQKSNVTTKLPRLASAKPREMNVKHISYDNTETSKIAIVVNNSNVTFDGQQTILSPRRNAKKKQKKFLNDLQSRREILEEETRIFLEDTKEQSQTYIKTRAYTNAKKIAKENKFLLIKSKPGDGGSSMAMKLLHDFTESRDRIIPLCILEVGDFDEAIGGTNSLILIDGLFDLNNVSREFKKEWIEKLLRLDNALRVNKRNNCVIITMGEEAYESLPSSLRDSKLFQSALVDISHEHHNLTFQEKKDFLNQYVAPYCDLTDSQFEELINCSLPFGFPKCCEIFRNNHFLHRKPFNFFQDPQIFIQDVLSTAQQEDPSRLAPLALVVLGNGTLSEKQLYNIIRKKNDVLWTTFENHYEVLSCERKDVKPLFCRAKGTFLQFDRNTSQYSFAHSAVQKAMVCLLGRIDLKPVIKNCELSNLPHMRTRSDLCRAKDQVLLESRCFKSLSKQIRKAMSRGDLMEAVSTMSVWEDGKFVDYFTDFLKWNNDEDLFLLQDASRKGVIEYTMCCNNTGVTENMISIAERTGQGKLLLDKCCAQNSPLAVVLLNKNIKPDIETIKVGVKSKNASILRVILSHLGKNFDHFVRTRSILADDFSSDVTIADEACLSGDINVVDTIIEHFPDLVSSKRELSFLILLKAAMTGGNDQVIDRMVEIGVNDEELTRRYSVVFSIACKNGEIDVAEYFGSKDVRLFTSRDKNNYTPLHSAAVGGTNEMANYLIRGGADPFALTVKKATALHLSCASGNVDITSFLIDRYPTLMEMEDNKKATPVHYATRGGSIEILTLLVERHANLAKVTTKKETVFHVSCHRGYLDIARLLAAECPELSHAATMDGFTALHFACTTDDLDLVRFLIEELGLDPLQKTNDGMNSLQLASGYGIKEYLQQKSVSSSSSCECRFSRDLHDD